MADNNVLQNFGILYRSYIDFMNEILQGKNLSYSDSIFLMNIGKSEGISQEKIAANLLIDRAAITRSVKRMEDNGLVKTERSVEDKRAKCLYLTQDGKKIYEYIDQENRKRLGKLFEGLESKEIDTFMKVLSTVVENQKK